MATKKKQYPKHQAPPGCTWLSLAIPIDLKERIKREAELQQRDLRVVVTNALEEKFPESHAAQQVVAK